MTADLRHNYDSQLKKQITIRLDDDFISYFNGVSEEVGIPYQSLINLYLRDCAASHRKLNLNWKERLFQAIGLNPSLNRTPRARGFAAVPVAT